MPAGLFEQFSANAKTIFTFNFCITFNQNGIIGEKLRHAIPNKSMHWSDNLMNESKQHFFCGETKTSELQWKYFASNVEHENRLTFYIDLLLE